MKISPLKTGLKASVVAPADQVGRQSEQTLYTSSPAAGFPAPGDDSVDRELNLHDFMVERPETTFFVRVAGDSMEGARIYSGDILVVERGLEPQSGDVVVAAVYGELVVKRFIKDTKGQALVSENEAYEPIRLDLDSDGLVWGIVRGTVRKF